MKVDGKDYVLVIEFRRHGEVQQTYLDVRENARAHVFEFNMGYFPHCDPGSYPLVDKINAALTAGEMEKAILLYERGDDNIEYDDGIDIGECHRRKEIHEVEIYERESNG